MASPDAFETPCLFFGIQSNLSNVRTKMNSELVRDPLPKFGLEEILDITKWVKSANDAMKDFKDTFHGKNLKTTGDELLNFQLKLARESSLQLTALLSDQSKYSSFAAKPISIKENSQDNDTKKDIQSLVSFLETFGKATWWGSLMTTESQEKQVVAIQVLKELLSPSARKVPPSLTASPVEGKMAFSQRGTAQHSKEFLEQRDALNVAARQPETPASSFEALTNACRFMLEVFEEEQRKYNALRLEIDNKMQALRDFVLAVQELPGLLKQYLLIRVGDIGKADLPVVKSWIGKDEIETAQKLLEEFRDIAIQEKAVREMSSKMGMLPAMTRASSESGYPTVSEPDDEASDGPAASTL